MAKKNKEELLLDEKKIIVAKWEKDFSPRACFVGVDRSLSSTGWAVVRNGELISSGTIKSEKAGANRLIEISKKIVNISEKTKGLVCMEDYAYAKNFQAHQLGELGGAVKLMLRIRKIDWIEASPLSIKKYVLGKGVAKKNLMIAGVYKKWGIMPKGDDEADAIALAYLSYYSFKYLSDGLGKVKDIECFEKILNLEKRKKKKKKRLTELDVE